MGRSRVSETFPIKGSFRACSRRRNENRGPHRHSNKKRGGNKTAVTRAIELQRLAEKADEITQKKKVPAESAESPGTPGENEPHRQVVVHPSGVQPRPTAP